MLSWLKPKWEHPDPAVRAEAVKSLTKQDVLALVALNDASDAIRLLALQRLTDQDAIAEVAKSGSAVSVQAAEALNDPRLIVNLVRTAAKAEVRRAALAKITDRNVLLDVATRDLDPEIRATAQFKRAGHDARFDFIKLILTALPVAPRTTLTPAQSGSLEEIGLALSKDRRFRISGVMDEFDDETAPVESTSHFLERQNSPKPTEPSLLDGVVSLIAHPSEGAATPLAPDAFYQIRVWRTAEATFHFSLEEKRPPQKPSAPVLTPAQ